MKIGPRTTHRDLATYVVLAAVALVLALTPHALTAQGAQPPQAAPAAQTAKPAAEKPAAPAKPLSPADRVLQSESYTAPPPELAEAVLAPRHLNISLSSPSPDKKWFLNEIGDGPVPMTTFSKPFHELGGVFVDFKANRARTLTIRNNVGIQIISTADGTKKQIEIMATPASGARKPVTPPPAVPGVERHLVA